MQKIPSNQVIPHLENSLQKKIETKYSFLPYESRGWNSTKSTPNQFALLKYYPKYYHCLELDKDPKPWPLLSKIRQIKTLHHFKYPYESKDIQNKKETIIKTLKRLLRNKRKSLKTLPVVEINSSEKNCLMEMCSFFSSVKTLEMNLPRSFFPKVKHDYIPRSLEKEIEKTYGNFWHTLKHVQHVEITTCDPYFRVLLQKMASCKKFLSSLKSFTLSFIYFYWGDRRLTAKDRLQILIQNREILQYVTHLNFNVNFGYYQNFHSYGYQIKTILENCPKLVSLNFPMERNFDRAKKNVALAPLKYIPSLQNIRVLTLRIRNVWGLIQEFELPPFLEKLTLHLYFVSCWRPLWRDLFEESTDNLPLKIKDEEKHKILLNFFEKFKPLTLLNDLSLSLPRFTEPNHIMQNFILPILKAVPTLKNSQCEFYSSFGQVNNLFDISTFFEDISPTQIESFKIFQHVGSEKYYYTWSSLLMSFNPKKAFTFLNLPHLKSIEIDTWIPQDFDFQNFFQACTAHPDIALKEIKLPRIHIDSMEALVTLLNILENMDFSRLKVHLGITLCFHSLTELTKHINSPIILPNNVSMIMEIYKQSFKELSLRPKGLTIMQNIFGKLDFNFYLLLKDKEMWRSEVHYFTLVKNNERYTQRPELGDGKRRYYIYKNGEYYKKNLQVDDSKSDIDNDYFFNQNPSEDEDEAEDWDEDEDGNDDHPNSSGSEISSVTEDV